MSGPYAETAWTYRGAGWAGVLPLPVGDKWPPPRGFTGWAGADPSGPDVQAWVDGPEGAGNVALRLPAGVYGLDVDDYGGKSGGAALARLVATNGPLPATWVVGSRVESVSGIRLYRADLPVGRRWLDEPAGHGAGVEAIHLGHRYAVAWPSIHPEGRKYVWRRPDGVLAGDGEVPRPEDLPAMPAAWVEALSTLGEARTGEQAGHEETVTVVRGFRDGDPCTRVTEARARAAGRLREASDGAALHPAGRDATHEIVALGHEGHVGARAALAEHYSMFVEVRAARDGGRATARGAAEGEWWRLVRGAVGKLTGPAATSCDCALWSGEGLLFDYVPAPADTIQADRSETPAGDDPSGGEGGVGGLDPPSHADALLARLLTAAQVRELRPPPALVEGLLTLDSEAWLIAKPGAGKTFVALDLAGHVGAGREWMGHAVLGGPVLYLAAEGAGGMGRRVQAWEQRNGPMANVHFLPVAVQAAREEQWAALVEVARRLQPALVVLDTQARITVGLNENDNSEMGQFVHAIGQLRRASGACVLVVHHLGRSGQDARGASAIDGAQDTELRLTRTADLRVVLETDKQRHLPDDVRLELELFPCALDDGGTSLVVGPPLSSVRPEKPWRDGLRENQATIADILAEHFDMSGGTRAEVAAVLRERGQWGKPGYSRTTFFDAWNALEKAGRIERVHATQRYVVNAMSSPDTAGQSPT